jgi:uncharacterized protein
MPLSLLPIAYPDFLLHHVEEITWEFLQTHQICAIIADLDNTLVPWHSEEVPPEVLCWLEMLNEKNIPLCVASNTHNLGRLARVAAAMRVLHVPENARKPSVYGVQKALATLQATPEVTLMVGDQLFTDMQSGKKLGARVALVNPLSTREFIGTKLVSRNLEKLYLRGAYTRPQK